MAYTGPDRRRYKRIKANFVVSYRPVTLSESANISQTKNLSQGGMLLTTNKAFAKGTLLKMSIQIPIISYKVELVGRVMESREVTKSLIYETRIVFQDLSLTVAQALGNTVKKAIDREKHKLGL